MLENIEKSPGLNMISDDWLVIVGPYEWYYWVNIC